jgi:uncharacterized SAM-binding protein YcdF (DUF218 family)
MALLVCVGIGFHFFSKTRKFADRALVVGAGLFLASALLPVGDWLLQSLERRFPALGACRYDGVILLGGALGPVEVNGALEEQLNHAADRVHYAAALARQNPDAPVLISGGLVFPRAGARSEAEVSADLLVQLGVPREQLLLETTSRTTLENANNLADQDMTGERRWALVTSAFHMPRAIGVFRKAGANVVAGPTDWRIDEGEPFLSWSVSSRLTNLDLAVKEYLGLAGYRIAGRTDELFPSPRGACGEREDADAAIEGAS